MLSPTATPHKLAYGVQEATALLSLGRTNVYQLVKSGHLRATKCGRRTLFLATDIAAFLATLQEQGR